LNLTKGSDSVGVQPDEGLKMMRNLIHANSQSRMVQSCGTRLAASAARTKMIDFTIAVGAPSILCNCFRSLLLLTSRQKVVLN
jgi:hypothetical protein